MSNRRVRIHLQGDVAHYNGSVLIGGAKAICFNDGVSEAFSFPFLQDAVANVGYALGLDAISEIETVPAPAE